MGKIILRKNNHKLLINRKITLYLTKFHPNCNLPSKVKKVAINPNKVSKFCNVAMPLAYSVFLDGNSRTCKFSCLLHQIALMFKEEC